jgi:hypothetical protein
MSNKQIMIIVAVLLVIGIGIAVTIILVSKKPVKVEFAGLEPAEEIAPAREATPEDSFNDNMQAIRGELQSYASQIVQYYETPTKEGGAGKNSSNLSIPKIALFMGFTEANNSLKTDNGEFRIIKITGDIVTIKGVGVEKIENEYPICTTTVNVKPPSTIITPSTTPVESRGTGF